MLFVLIAFITLFLSASSQQSQKLFNLTLSDSEQGHHKLRQLVFDNCLIEDQHNYVYQITSQDRRRLAASDPHGIRMTPVFPDSPIDPLNNQTVDINLDILKKLYFIAAKYYEKIIKVTQLSASLKIYPSSFGQCGQMNVPSIYQTAGFSQDTTDAIILIRVYNDTSSSTVASANTCVYATWPTYGFVNYNGHHVGTNLALTGAFHQNAYVTIHQLAHFLGVANYKFKNRMKAGYGQSGFLLASQTIALHPDQVNFPNVEMFIMANTKNYVQTYFNCNDTTIGALLQDQGGSGTLGSHWERSVYYDEALTGTVWSSMMKISGLTLNLFKDTGYYYDVDVSLAVPVYFGKGKGCSFALNQANETSNPNEYCSGTQDKCGFYGQYRGYCGTQTLSNKSYIRTYSNTICNRFETTINASTSSYYYYGPSGRCFNRNGGYTPTCFKSYCDNNKNIIIDAYGQTITCNVGDTSKPTSLFGTLVCPTNNQQFCSIKDCQNWCYTQGLCLNGQCILLDNCSLAISNCLFCQTDNLHRCIQCTTNLYPSSNRLQCVSCSESILNCVNCSILNNKTICQSCVNTHYPSQNYSKCVICSNSISNCASCILSEVNLMPFCLQCSNSLYPKYANHSYCDTCSNVISFCDSCSTENRTTICLACATNFYPNQNKTYCNLCNQTINNCFVCSINNGSTQCDQCQDGLNWDSITFSCQNFTNSTNSSSCLILNCYNCDTYGLCNLCFGGMYPNQNRSSCNYCNFTIPDCMSCSMNNGSTQCDYCYGGLIWNPVTFSCQNSTNSTNCSIPNCSLCNGSICYSCQSPLIPTLNSRACQTCSNRFSYCSSCQLYNGVSICVACNYPLVPNQNKTSCVSCSSRIYQCSICNVNSTGDTICIICNSGFWPNINGIFGSSGNLCSAYTCKILNCSSCSFNGSFQKCTSCFNNMYPNVDGTSCLYCNQSISNCNTCQLSNGMTLCNKCTNNFVLSSSKTSCDNCSFSISECSTCSQAGSIVNCTSCLNNKFPTINLQNCTTCDLRISDCSSCSSNQYGAVKCTQCGNSKFVSLNFTSCVTCQTLISNCNVCVDGLPVVCSQCVNSTYIFPTQNRLSCKQCSKHIDQCTSCSYNQTSFVVTCIACTLALYPTSNGLLCKYCPDLIQFCQTCTSSSVCTKCVSGYYVSSPTTCLPCLQPCLRCSGSATICQSCIQGYYLISSNNTCQVVPKAVASYGGVCRMPDGTQILCQRGCQVCSCISATSQACSSSFKGYVIDSSNQIVNCANGCGTCNPLNPTTCYTCLDLFSLSGNTCVNCHSSCATCDRTNPNVCLTCPQGSVIDSSKTCSVCTDPLCNICNSNGTCNKCIAGYVRDIQTGGCQQCASSCGTCQQNYVTICTSCAQMFYLNGTDCLSCPKGCKKCTVNGCSSCIQGYTLNVANKKCNKNCKLPCSTCSATDSTFCTSCYGGYTYNQSRGKCNPNYCNSGCQFCPLGTRLTGGSVCQNCTVSNCGQCKNAAAVCQSCLLGYYLASSSSCIKCSSQCLTCRSLTYCIQCNQGYTLLKDNSPSKDNVFEGRCIACEHPCKTCVLSPKHCQTCAQKYQFKDRKCVLIRKVVLVYVIDFDYDLFFSQRKFFEFLRYFKQLMNLQNSSRAQTFTLGKAKRGSVELQAQIGNDPSFSPSLCDQASTVENIGSSNQISGFNILQTSVTTQSDNENENCDPSSMASQNMFLILGIIIGVPIAIIMFIVIVILIMYCKKRSASKVIPEQSKIEIDDIFDSKGKPDSLNSLRNAGQEIDDKFEVNNSSLNIRKNRPQIQKQKQKLKESRKKRKNFNFENNFEDQIQDQFQKYKR